MSDRESRVEIPESQADHDPEPHETVLDTSVAIRSDPRILPRAPELRAGEIVGDYEILSFLAKGGCGSVYAALHRPTGRRVALKALSSHAATRERMTDRFLREFSVIRLLGHPNIVEVYDTGELPDGRPFYAMEFLEGMTAVGFLRQRGRLTPGQALTILEPVASALIAAHAAGIVHRDVKLSNIFLVNGEPPTVKLLDFGIAKLLDTSELQSSWLTSQGRMLGTVTTMAPEQILSIPVDARTDIYALGIALYAMLVGSLPFRSPSYEETLRQHLEDPPPRPSASAPVSREIDAVVLRCLEKKPERRFPTVQAFIAALREAVSGPVIAADKPAPVSGTALGAYLKLHVAEDAGGDDLYAEMGRVLDAAEGGLRAAGFLIASATSDEILAVLRLQGADPGAWREQRRAALTRLAILHEQLTAVECAGSQISVTLCAHVDEILEDATAEREGSEGIELVGGALLDPSSWAPEDHAPRCCATLEAAEGITVFPAVVGDRVWVTLDPDTLSR